MTIKAIILALQAIARKHGDSVQVCFDCPTCKTSFKPSVIVAEPIVTVHAEGKV